MHASYHGDPKGVKTASPVLGEICPRRDPPIDEARTWLDKSVRWIDASTPNKPADSAFGTRIDWQTWLALRVLRREAESSLQAAKAGP